MLLYIAVHRGNLRFIQTFDITKTSYIGNPIFVREFNVYMYSLGRPLAPITPMLSYMPTTPTHKP